MQLRCLRVQRKQAYLSHCFSLRLKREMLLRSSCGRRALRSRGLREPLVLVSAILGGRRVALEGDPLCMRAVSRALCLAPYAAARLAGLAVALP